MREIAHKAAIEKGAKQKETVARKPERQVPELERTGSAIGRVLFMQQTTGNSVVGKQIRSGAFQAKLKVESASDIYEEEADRLADHVMRMTETIYPQQEEEENIRAKTISGHVPDVTPGIESGINSMKKGGQVLPEGIRAFFEPRFGADFSQVRVHTGPQASQSAQSIQAKAFTTGNHIVFNQGQYNPGTNAGKHLLAHELTHVVQQGNKNAYKGDNNLNQSIRKKEGKVIQRMDQYYPGWELGGSPYSYYNQDNSSSSMSNDTSGEKKSKACESMSSIDCVDNTPSTIVYKVVDKYSLIRTGPPNFTSLKKTIPWDTQLVVLNSDTKDTQSYVNVRSAYGDKKDWGWTLASNIEVTDVPTTARYGCSEFTGFFIKNGKYLQQDNIDALNEIDNPIEIKDGDGEVTNYYLRLTECMYPSSFSHVSKGHYTGHCVDIAFSDENGGKIEYEGEAKKELEKQGENSFDVVNKEDNHLHAQVDYPTWVSGRKVERLREMVKERKNEY